MTNGLTKTARARQIPAIPGTSGIPNTPEQFVLPPSPPGSRYEKRERWLNNAKTEKEIYFELVKVAGVDGESKYLNINFTDGFAGFGIPLRAGDKYVWGFAPRYNMKPTVFIAVVVEEGPNATAIPSNPPENMVLIEVLWTPFVPAEPPTYPLPPGVLAVKYPDPVWPNGYPRKPDNAAPTTIAGTIQVPRATGGYDTIRVPGVLSRSSASSKILDRLQINEPTPRDRSRYLFEPHGVPYITIKAFAGAPGVPTIPGYTVYDQVRAWDAGANSIASVDGDLHVTFNVLTVMGAKVGFFPEGPRPSADASLLVNAFYVYSTADRQRWVIIDNGRTVQPVQNNIATDSTEYEIRRVAGIVSYYVDGELMFTSKTTSDGPLRVGSALYKTGDVVL